MQAEAEDGEAGAGLGAAIAVSEDLPPEIAFLEGRGVDRAALVAAAAIALGSGVTADRALLAAGTLSAEQFYHHLAEHLGVSFLHDPLPVAASVSIDDIMTVEIVPLAPNRAGIDFAIAPRGPTLAALLRRFGPDRAGASPPVAITTPRRMAALVRRRHRHRIVREASHGLSDWDPRLSALAGWSFGQQVFGFVAGFAVAAGIGASPASTFEAICLGLSVLFLGTVAVRMAATIWSPAEGAAPTRRMRDDELPHYTIVVPLYRESRVLPRLVQALSRLDYPVARLDIKLVLESDDFDTIEAAHAERLPDCYEILLAPPGRPRTKPRALNVALRFAVGGYLVIYDAEDEPDPGQLRAAVQAFANAGTGVGCLQARLAIDNDAESWLTRMFALEYAALFDVINPGLARLGLPLALGGTSNHFRLEALRAVNGWDAWNVTEDIDLGVRLARFGFAVKMLDSTTFEEAPHTLKAWIGQRRRWQKGWMVTLKTHSRNPARLFAEIGPIRGLSIFAMLCGTIASALLWPFFVVTVAVDAAFGPLLAPVTRPEKAWSALALLLLVSGVATLLWPALLGARRRGLAGAVAALAFMPAYMGILCYASWAALVEMLGRPYAWTKTEHGLARKRVSRIASADDQH